MSEPYDCTGKIGNLVGDNLRPEWPMYSFNSPSYIVWNAIAAKLHAAGWADKKIKEWLQSKEARHALDGDLGDALIAAAEGFVDSYYCEMENFT